MRGATPQWRRFEEKRSHRKKSQEVLSKLCTKSPQGQGARHVLAWVSLNTESADGA